MRMKQDVRSKVRSNKKARYLTILSLTLLFVILFSSIAFAATSEKLIVTMTSSNGTVTKGSTDNLVNTINLAAPAGDGITVSKVAISTSYSGGNTGVPTYKLYIDNGDGVFNIATDTFRNYSTLNKSKYTYNSFNKKVNANTTLKLFFAADVPANAVTYATISTSMATGDVAVNKPDSVTAFSPNPLKGGTFTIIEAPVADTLTVSHTAIANFNAAQGTTNSVVERLNLAASTGNGITVNAIKVDKIGTALDSDITAAKLIDDADNDGVVDAGETVLDSKVFSGSTLTFAPVGGISIAAGSTKNLIITIDLSATAVPSATVQTSIANGSVTVASPDLVAAFSAITGSLVIIADLADTVTVSQTLIASGSLTRSSTDNLIQRLLLSINQDQATVSSLMVTRTGTATDADTVVNGIKLWRDTDNSGTVNAGDTQLSTSKTFAGATVTFDNVNLTVTAGTPASLLITYSISSTATTGAAIGSRIASVASIVLVSAVDTVSLISMPLTSSLQTIQASSDSLTVTHTASVDIYAAAGSTNNLLDTLTFTAGAGDGVTVSGVRINQIGTALDSDTSAVKLIDDSNNNGWYDVGDAVLDTKTFTSGIANFGSFSYVIAPNSSKKMYIVADIASSAVLSRTIRTSLADNSYVTLSGPDTVSSASFPIASATCTIVAPHTNPVVTVSQTPVAGTSVGRSTTNNLIQTLNLSISEATTSVTSIKVTRDSNSVPPSSDSDVTANGVKLWLDRNSDGAFNPATDAPALATSTFIEGVATFDLATNPIFLFENSQILFVSFDISATAQIGANLGSKINTASDIMVINSTVTLASTPLLSNLRTIVSSNDALTVSHVPPTNYNANQGITNQVLDRISLVASAGDGITVTGIRVDKVGTATDSSITALRLYNDADYDGVVDAGETLLDSKTFTAGTLTFSPSLTMPASSIRNLLIAADISMTATVGSTLSTSIAGNASITVAGPDTVNTFSTLTGATLTIVDASDVLTVSQILISGSIPRSAVDVPMQRLSLSISTDQATVSSLTVTRTGTATNADTQANGIKLWRDADNSGTVNAGDMQISTSKTFAGATVIFDNVNLTVAAGTPASVLITYSISPTAMTSATIGATTSAMTVSATDTITGLPQASNMRTITAASEALSVTQMAVVNSIADQGRTNLVLNRLALTVPAGDGITVTSIMVNQMGTALTSDITAFKLFDDADNDGVIDGGEMLYDSKIPSGTSITFAPAGGLFINAGTVKNLIIAVDIATTATPSRTIQTSIVNNASISVVAPDAVASFSTLNGGTITITDKPDMLTVSQTAISAGSFAPGSDDNLVQSLVLVTNEDQANLTSITIARTGTSSDSDVKTNGVKLWLDINSNGTLETGTDMMLGSTSYASGMATLTLATPLNITTISQRIFVTCSVSSTAVVGNTIGSSINSSSNVVAALPDYPTLAMTPLMGVTNTIQAQ